MTKRIFRSICLVAMGVFLASVTLFMGVLYDYFSDVQRAQLRMQTQLAAQGVAHEGMAYFDGLEAQDYRITWVDAGGSVRYDSKKDWGEMENHLEREEIQEALAQGLGESARASATLLDRAFYCAQRLPDGTVLRLSVTQNSLFTLLWGMLRPLAVIFVLAAGSSLLLASRLSRKIVEPLNALDLNHPLAAAGYQELAPLLRRLEAQQREIRRQGAELSQAERVRREFTANVSHELKTPLQTISGSAELLAGGIVKPEDVAGFGERIYTEARRLIALVEDIIKLSHLDEGGGDPRFEDVDLYPLAEAVLETLEQEAEAAGVTLTLEGGSTPLRGVPQLLSSILFNLCDNAVKYNRPGGSVTVALAREEGGAVIAVRDTGIGIPQEYQERVFERFYRVDKSRSKAVGGTGLGLSIVKHAVGLHRGRVELESVPGQGTTVAVHLPG